MCRSGSTTARTRNDEPSCSPYAHGLYSARKGGPARCNDRRDWGGDIEATIEVGAATPAHALEAVTRAAAAAAYQTEDSSPTSLLLMGRQCPRWALLVGRLLAIPTLGASLLLLRMKRTSIGTASVVDGPWGPQLRLSGQLPESLPARIRALLLAPGDAPISAAEAHADINATIARRRRIDLTQAAPLLNFDSGLSLTVRDQALIGRAPTPLDDPSALLLPIDDPGRSVSKTHLAVGVDARGFWICDLHSTNGSAITDADGVKIPCIAGQRHYVIAGSTVHMGDRSFSVVLSGLSIGQSR